VGFSTPYIEYANLYGFLRSLFYLLKVIKSDGGNDEETMQMARLLKDSQPNEYIRALYSRHKYNPQIKWKESIKKVVGLAVATESGLDI